MIWYTTSFSIVVRVRDKTIVESVFRLTMVFFKNERALIPHVKRMKSIYRLQSGSTMQPARGRHARRIAFDLRSTSSEAVIVSICL